MPDRSSTVPAAKPLGAAFRPENGPRHLVTNPRIGLAPELAVREPGPERLRLVWACRFATAIVLPSLKLQRRWTTQRLSRRQIFSLGSTDAFSSAKVKEQASYCRAESGH